MHEHDSATKHGWRDVVAVADSLNDRGCRRAGPVLSVDCPEADSSVVLRRQIAQPLRENARSIRRPEEFDAVGRSGDAPGDLLPYRCVVEAREIRMVIGVIAEYMTIRTYAGHEQRIGSRPITEGEESGLDVRGP